MCEERFPRGDVDGVVLAEPNNHFVRENKWQVLDLNGPERTWIVEDGFGTCFPSCRCRRTYQLRVDDGGRVTILSVELTGPLSCDRAGE
ncbi:MAG: hypothetical protein ACYTGC_13685 [Planctomycetota bacterium]|jgi:hypothetical protein